MVSEPPEGRRPAIAGRPTDLARLGSRLAIPSVGRRRGRRSWLSWRTGRPVAPARGQPGEATALVVTGATGTRLAVVPRGTSSPNRSERSDDVPRETSVDPGRRGTARILRASNPDGRWQANRRQRPRSTPARGRRGRTVREASLGTHSRARRARKATVACRRAGLPTQSACRHRMPSEPERDSDRGRPATAGTGGRRSPPTTAGRPDATDLGRHRGRATESERPGGRGPRVPRSSRSTSPDRLTRRDDRRRARRGPRAVESAGDSGVARRPDDAGAADAATDRARADAATAARRGASHGDPPARRSAARSRGRGRRAR